MKKKVFVKKFYPQGVTIIEEKTVEGDPEKVVKVLFSESIRCGAISLEPSEGNGHMRVLEHNPKYYRSTEVVPLSEANKKPECASALRRVNPKIHRGLVKYGTTYAPLLDKDMVFDFDLKCIWPQPSTSKVKETPQAHTLVSVLKNAHTRK